jgi:HAD superfamily phosphoserine phosphatase-like hydrolase
VSSPYRIVFFDNDGTLTDNRSTWIYTHSWLGTWEPDGRRLLEHHLKNRTPYDQFARDSVRLWKGAPREKFLERLRTIGIRRDVPEVLRALMNAGMKLAVLSSGFSLWREMWFQREGIRWDYYHANDLVFDSSSLCTGEIIMHVTDNVPGMDKGSWVEWICAEPGIPKEERVFVGDGWGDVPGFKACAFGVAIDPFPEEVRVAAKYVLNGSEFAKVRDLCLHEKPG